MYGGASAPEQGENTHSEISKSTGSTDAGLALHCFVSRVGRIYRRRVSKTHPPSSTATGLLHRSLDVKGASRLSQVCRIFLPLHG